MVELWNGLWLKGGAPDCLCAGDAAKVGNRDSEISLMPVVRKGGLPYRAGYLRCVEWKKIMAKGARGVDRRQVKDWFSGLTFEVQQSVLDDLGKTSEAKAGRISALEKELAELRGAGIRVAGTAAGKPAAKVSPKKGMKIEPKYRHPKTGQTWAGRGVHPTWIVEYLKKRGNKLEDLLIKK